MRVEVTLLERFEVHVDGVTVPERRWRGRRGPGLVKLLSLGGAARIVSSLVTMIAVSSLIAAVRARTAAALVTACTWIASRSPSWSRASRPFGLAAVGIDFVDGIAVAVAGAGNLASAMTPAA